MTALRATIFIAAALAVAAILWQRHVIAGMSAQAEGQARQLGEVIAANAGLAESLAALRAARATDNAVVLNAADEAERLSRHAATLERRLQEALYVQNTAVDFDAPLPVDAVDALCLRYRAAAGHYGDSSSRDTAPGADARAHNTPAPACDGWRTLTLRQVVEWAGYLLDHAGLERTDKAALRAWAKENN